MDRVERHFEKDLETLTAEILRLGSQCQEAIEGALEALTRRDPERARQVVAGDEVLDQQELLIDQLCTDLLALRQPMASDLRFITTALKITPELERMGDLAVNISERAIELSQEPELKPLIDIPRMARMAVEMLQGCLEAFVRHDAAAARAILRRDDEVDRLMEQVFRELLSFMIEDPRTISRAIRLTFVAKYIERIADGCTNICEMVVYMAEGRIIRHGGFHPIR
ncbi:MAG TPA: phosphate signaling complex protein PhoU [Candidatus Polarisedimenticolia bacterium]|nr:phosphate signaling complex protein PhoU [Candidatus Polarisedimenticolia bacterium]